MHLVVSRRLLLLPVVAMLAACDGPMGHLTARATDEWTHTYPLKPGGELRIANTNGLIEIEGVDGSTVEVRAERIARGVSEDAARELLPRIVIKEDATPERVSLSTERFSGIMLGAGFEVRYHVKAPKSAAVLILSWTLRASSTPRARKCVPFWTRLLQCPGGASDS